MTRRTTIRNLGQWEPHDLNEGTGPVATVEAPAKSASRSDWDDYARSQGVDPDEYGSKDDLQAALEK